MHANSGYRYTHPLKEEYFSQKRRVQNQRLKQNLWKISLQRERKLNSWRVAVVVVAALQRSFDLSRPRTNRRRRSRSRGCTIVCALFCRRRSAFHVHRRGRVERATDCAVPTAPTPRGCEVRTGLTTAVYIWGYAGWRWWEGGRLGWRGGGVVRMDEVKVVAVERALCEKRRSCDRLFSLSLPPPPPPTVPSSLCSHSLPPSLYKPNISGWQSSVA